MQSKESSSPRTPESRVPPAVPPKQDAKPQDRDWYERMKDQMEGASAGSEAPGAQKKAEKGRESQDERKEKREKRKNSLERMTTSVGDFFRDVDTANQKARETFGDKTAFTYGLQGLLSLGAGAGIEAALSPMWDSMWQGKQTFIERFKIGPGTAQKLNEFVLSPEDWKARVGYFLKEGSEDFAIAGINNLLFTWRMQKLLKEVEPQHLAWALTIDALEAFLSPKLPDDMRRMAKGSQNSILEDKNIALDRQRRDLQRDYEFEKRRGTEYYYDSIMQQQSEEVHPGKVTNPRYQNVRKERQTNQPDLDAILEQIDALKNKPIVIPEGNYDPGKFEEKIRSLIKYSNPVTDLGISMILHALKVEWDNYWKVREVRKEKGGLAGKKVYMPTQDRGRSGDRRPYGERRQYEDRKPYGERKSYQDRGQQRYEDRRGADEGKKVYQSRWQKPKTQQEVDLEKLEKFE